MRRFSVLCLLLALLGGCGGTSDLSKLQGTWVEVPTPREWFDKITDEQYQEYLSTFVDREPKILVFKGNTVTLLTGDRTLVRSFSVTERQSDGRTWLQFAEDGPSGEIAQCRFRSGLLEYGWYEQMPKQDQKTEKGLTEHYRSIEGGAFQRSDE
ncbi:MAG: hypothetical protein ABFD16_10275 [Thermoguttaceae bacterium]